MAMAWKKRVFDLAVAAVLLLMTILLWPLLAGLIRLSSRGSSIFRQERMGIDDDPFMILKFRTLIENLYEDGARDVCDNDQTMIRLWGLPLGWFLRYSHLDELPQLINVLRGEMSVVGPRPFAMARLETARAHGHKPWRVRPGCISPTMLLGGGGREESIGWLLRVGCDQQYAGEHSVPYDLRLMWAVVRSKLFSSQDAPATRLPQMSNSD